VTAAVGTPRLGMSFALAAIAMMFLGLTSALVVRQGLDPGWRAIPMPRLLLANTLVLLASSVALEKARRAAGPWLAATVLLGLVFLTGQLIAWRDLAAQGLYLSNNPHAAFFYLLTGLHGLHLLGGLGALAFSAARRTWLEITALYWHFMGALWIYLFLLLFVWR